MLRQNGFTLIELMIVIAIVAILAAIAVPAYQDYVARAQVSEGLGLATSAKLAIATYYADKGAYPSDNSAAGMADPASINGKYVRSVTVNNTGIIEVEFSSSASDKISGQTLTMQVSDRNGSLSWRCGGVDGKYMPSSCR